MIADPYICNAPESLVHGTIEWLYKHPNGHLFSLMPRHNTVDTEVRTLRHLTQTWIPYADFEREKLTRLEMYLVVFPKSNDANGFTVVRFSRALHSSAELIGYSFKDWENDSESSRLLKRAEFLKAVCEKEGVEWLPKERCAGCKMIRCRCVAKTTGMPCDCSCHKPPNTVEGCKKCSQWLDCEEECTCQCHQQPKEQGCFCREKTFDRQIDVCTCKCCPHGDLPMLRNEPPEHTEGEYCTCQEGSSLPRCTCHLCIEETERCSIHGKPSDKQKRACCKNVYGKCDRCLTKGIKQLYQSLVRFWCFNSSTSSPSNSMVTPKTVKVDKRKLIRQGLPRLAQSVQNLARYGMTREKIIKEVRSALNKM